MSCMCAFLRYVHVAIFGLLIHLDAQFSIFIKCISSGPCMRQYYQSSIHLEIHIFCLGLLNSLAHFKNSFLVPCIIPNSSSISLLKRIGHFFVLLMDLILSSSSNMAIYIQFLEFVKKKKKNEISLMQFVMPFWYFKNNLTSSMASFPEILLYKLFEVYCE